MSWLRRLINTFRPGRLHRDIDRELSFHIAERVDQLRDEGMSLDDARFAAQRQFGNALRIREDTHETNNIGWVERLTHDLRVTLRMIRKSPGFALAAILTLALGIGATTAVFSVVNAVLIRPLPYPDPDRLVGVWHSAQFQGITSNNVRLSSTMYLTYREHAETFEDFGLWRSTRASVTGLGEPEQVPALAVTYGTLPAIGVPPAIGRWFSAADDSAGTPETVILSYGYWQRRFAGSASVIGTRVTIDSKPREVIGVMPQSFRFLNAEAAVILPQRFQGAELLPNDVHSFVGIARLKPGVTLAQANADVGRMLPIWIRERGTNANVLTAARFGPALRPVKADVIGDVGSVLWLLMGTIGVVLVIACANVANLLLVRAEGRRQEFTLRAALGAGWSHIARHLLVESLALALLGGALGVGLAYRRATTPHCDRTGDAPSPGGDLDRSARAHVRTGRIAPVGTALRAHASREARRAQRSASPPRGRARRWPHVKPGSRTASLAEHARVRAGRPGGGAACCGRPDDSKLPGTAKRRARIRRTGSHPDVAHLDSRRASRGVRTRCTHAAGHPDGDREDLWRDVSRLHHRTADGDGVREQHGGDGCRQDVRGRDPSAAPIEVRSAWLFQDDGHSARRGARFHVDRRQRPPEGGDRVEQPGA